MSIAYIFGNFLNLLLLKLLRVDYRLLFFIPKGRYSNLDILRFKTDIVTIFDVGANIGQSIKSYSKIFNESVIYSFEPNPVAFNYMKHKHGKNKKNKMYNMALGEASGIGVLNVPIDSEMATINKNENVATQNNHSESINVTITTGFDFMLDQNIQTIDLLKIDVEGYEIQVLKGFGQHILSNRIKLIYIEAGYDPEDQQHTYYNIISEYLVKFGFYPSGFYDNFRWGDKKHRLGFNNVLFVNTNIKM
jgi:FkbM family methyltransferase